MNETLQGRIPNEFRLHGVKTKEQANRFLKKTYLPKHNRRFKIAIEETASAFVPVSDEVNLERIFCIKEQRTVNADNTVSFYGRTFQIDRSPLRISFAKCRVMVLNHIDGTFSIVYGPHLVGRYDASAKPLPGGCHTPTPAKIVPLKTNGAVKIRPSSSKRVFFPKNGHLRHEMVLL